MRPSIDMAHDKAIVELHPLTLHHFPRTLTFHAASDRIEIGRASKRENKKLQPNRHNALFDSRVMSRTHATLCAAMDKKLIYIRDPGSMHGTLINDGVIPVGQDIILRDGDVLTFGVEVVRGSETFPPLKVRCGCQWGTVKEKNQHQTPSNTFIVPEDDDDDVVEVENESGPDNHATVDLTTDQTSESNASSDSEDSRSVIEVYSPMTSPIRNDALKEAPPTDVSEAPLQEPSSDPFKPDAGEVNSEQPLATPRMTPPSLGYESEELGDENQEYGDFFLHSSDEESSVESGESDMDGEGEDEDEIQIEQEEHDLEYEPEPDLEDEQLQKLQNMPNPFELNFGSGSHQPSVMEFKSPETTETGERPPSFPPNVSKPVLPASNPPTTSLQPERPAQENPFTLSIPPLYASSRYDAYPSFSATGSYPGLYMESHNTLPPIMPPHQTAQYSLGGRLPLQSPYPMYNDGPFASAQSKPDAPAPRADSGGCSKPDYVHFLDPLTPMMPRKSCDTTRKAPSPPQPLGAMTPDLSKQQSAEGSKKRKAAELEEEITVPDPVLDTVTTTVFPPEPLESPNEDVELPDAQPQTISAILNDSPDSELVPVSVSVSKGSREGKDERPLKKVKTEHKGSFRSHAATAVVAAMVGAVGTVAALASLPPDFFA